MSKLRVYIAGSSKELDRVRAMAAAIDAMEHLEITERWWIGAEAWAGRDSEQSTAHALAAARACRDGVRAADLLVMLMPESASGGSMVELGIAIELNMWIILSDAVPHRSVFYAFADRVDHDLDVLRLLREAAKSTSRVNWIIRTASAK
jgi:hypothetical protein